MEASFSCSCYLKIDKAIDEMLYMMVGLPHKSNFVNIESTIYPNEANSKTVN